MTRRLNSDLVWGLSLLAFCGIVTLIILDQPAGHTVRGAPGARFFPLLLVAWLSVLALLLLIAGIRSVRSGSTPTDVDWKLAGRVAGTTAGFVAYVYVMENLRDWARAVGIFPPRGSVFALTTAIFLASFFWLLGERRPAVNAALTLSVTAALYISFIPVLDVRFP